MTQRDRNRMTRPEFIDIDPNRIRMPETRFPKKPVEFEWKNSVNFPMSYSDLIQILSANERQDVTESFTRGSITATASTTTTLTIAVPKMDSILLPLSYRLYSDTFSSLITVTAQFDNQPAFLSEVQMSDTITISAGMAPRSAMKRVYTIVNDDTVNATFTEELDGLLVTNYMYSELIQPLLEANYLSVAAIARLLRKKEGS